MQSDLRSLQEIAQLADIARSHSDFARWKERNDGKLGAAPTTPVKKKRVPDQILTNCNVDWVEWGGTSNQKIKISHREVGCTVHFFGKKREIILPSGKVLVKMDGSNLRIGTDPVNDGSH